MVGEKFSRVNTGDRVDRDVGRLVLETTVYINTSINAPDSCTEALNGTELVPFARLCVVYFQGYVLPNLVSATTNDHHERTKEQG